MSRFMSERADIMSAQEPDLRAETIIGRTILFQIPSARKLPLNVYVPAPSPFEDAASFMVPVYTDLVPRELGVGLVRKFKPHYGGMVAWCKSKRRPEVYCNDVDGLIRELQRLDARNVSRDRVFEEKQVNALARVTAFPTDIPDLRERYPNAMFVMNLLSVEFTL